MNSEDSKEKKEVVGRSKGVQEVIIFLKYLVFSGSAGIIEAVSYLIIAWVLGMFMKTTTEVFFLGQKLSTIAIIAQMISLALSIIWNFVLNRKYTFKSSANISRVLALAFAFYIPFYPLSTYFVGWAEPIFKSLIGFGFLAKMIAMVANFVLEFLWQKFYVFREKPESKK